MSFPSILFESPEDREAVEQPEAPAFLLDLNLDQVLSTITAGREEYDLEPFFHISLNRTDAIEYRHEVMQDLEGGLLLEHVKAFTKEMRTVRQHLPKSDKFHYRYQDEAWFLKAVEIYCEAVMRFADGLSKMDLRSRGFLSFREYLRDYAGSPSFTSLVAETKNLKADLAEVKYCVLIKGDRFTVLNYESEPDYSVEVEETFEKFKQGAVKDYRVKYSDGGMNHIEAKILEFVALLYPDIFSNLDDFCTRNSDFLDEAIAAFDREVQFYIAYLEYMEKFKRVGLIFCYPSVSADSKGVYDYDGFDLALAHKLIGESSPVVCNDFYMKGNERIIVVTGPNQGGKTTFARTFGQLHYLARLGCPVPGREARLFLFDRLFTHFEREEDIKNLRGKLEDDLVRVHHILGRATSNSIVIMNEIFTSTTLQDAVFLSKKVMEAILELDLLCVWVTFIDELATFGDQTVSMMSTIVPGNPTLRTFKILRMPADGLSYAMSIAEKYRLTYESLKERIRS